MDNKQRMAELLNLAFEKEYNDVFLYLKEAELFRKKLVEGDEVSQLFDGFSLMELRHADRIASKLLELGKKPDWVFYPLETSNSLRVVLEKHVGNEAEAIRLYDELISICDDVDFCIILKGIREDEKEHREKAARILKHLGA